MNKLSVVLTMLLFAVLSFFGGNRLGERTVEEKNIGSVQIANEYMSTSTVNGQAAFQIKISTSTAVLGSVTISSSSAAAMYIYNWDGVGTMTASGTLVAYFPANATAGTYTYDTFLNEGLYISTTASMTGNYTITYRVNY